MAEDKKSIFNDCDGGVLRVRGTCAEKSVAAISVDDINFEVPITGFTLDLSTNHQFLHTLDEFIYLYAFGDRIGELTLSGVSFAGTCVSDSSGNDEAGLVDRLAPKSVLDYYKDCRISRAAGPKAAIITMGGSKDVLIGFLTGVRFDLPNPSLPIVQWALRYNVVLNKTNVPSTARRGSASGGGSTTPGAYRPTGRYPVSPSTLPSLPFELPTWLNPRNWPSPMPTLIPTNPEDFLNRAE